MSDKKKEEYEVGYRKPPRETQFQKGVSGNPSGRKKKARDLASALVREGNTQITLTENGRKVTISRNEVVAKMMTNNAMKGKTSDIKLYLTHYPQAVEAVALALAKVHSENSEHKTARELTREQLMKIVTSGLKYKEIQEEENRALANASIDALVDETIDAPEDSE